MEWYLKVLRHYADFNGRARPKEYWMFVLFYAVFGLAATFIDILVKELANGKAFVFICRDMYMLAMFLPALALTVRRLHDTGRSGWWTLSIFVPASAVQALSIAGVLGRDGTLPAVFGIVLIAGSVCLLVLTLLKGQQGDNRYGSDPKTVQPPYGELARLRSAATTLTVAAAVGIFAWIWSIFNISGELGISVIDVLSSISTGYVTSIFPELLLLAAGIILLPRMRDGASPLDRVRRRAVFPVIAYAAMIFFFYAWSVREQMELARLNGITVPVSVLVSNAVWILFRLLVLLFALSLLLSGGKWRRAAGTALAVASGIMLVFMAYYNYVNSYHNTDGNAINRLLNLVTFLPVAYILLGGVFGMDKQALTGGVQTGCLPQTTPDENLKQD
ncbi:MAG: DUF805 domain-containing protein [Prevotellaceae bacterium]|jgi:uncharacterized membrane protein YhaH (DUF805 family)|nr:DUF805 domain-containing protein [Prevotellaceae bacterium]